jgi:zinc transport system substrate-binding protein
MKRCCLITAILAYAWFAGRTPAFCGEGRVPVFVSIIPQKYFVEKIGGEFVSVSVMVQPGASPAIYEPKPAQMVALSKARIYFAVGVPFEAVWLERVVAANPSLIVVHTDKGIQKRTMREHHHQEKRHDHQIKDPHIWLSPPLVMVLARNVLDALCRIDPSHGAAYETNYKRFIIELVELDAEIRRVFAGNGKGMAFMVFHPAWGYFAEAYGLEQIPIEIEGKEPKPAELQALIKHAQRRGIRIIFVQPQFSAKSAKTIARAIGGEVAYADPLALDWAENLRKQAATFERALR